MVFLGQKPTSISPTPTILELEPRAGSQPTPFIDADGRVKNNIVITTSSGQLSALTACGYVDGDLKSVRGIPPGWDCRVDLQNSFFGLCETKVTSVKDCGFVHACVDSFKCTSGCGNFDLKFSSGSGYRQITCDSDSNIPHCWDVVLDVAPESQYTWHACGPFSSTTHTYLLTTTSPSGASIVASSSSQTTPTTALGGNSTSGNDADSGQDAQSNNRGQSDTNNAAPIGVIVGASLAGLVVLCCTILLALWIAKRRGSKDASAGMSGLSRQKQRKQCSPQQSPVSWPGSYMESKQLDGSLRPVEIGPGQHLDLTNCSELPAASTYAETEAPGQNRYPEHNPVLQETRPL
ncbi:hypothetical protein MCOR25_010550 [Pyricularia grisea]|nr:hypothetical protein MCOR25_010550 [Pyricularia grisea]